MEELTTTSATNNVTWNSNNGLVASIRQNVLGKSKLTVASVTQRVQQATTSATNCVTLFVFRALMLSNISEQSTVLLQGTVQPDAVLHLQRNLFHVQDPGHWVDNLCVQLSTDVAPPAQR